MLLVLGGAGAFLGAGMLGVVVTLARESGRTSHDIAALEARVAELSGQLASARAAANEGRGRPNVLTAFNPDVNSPTTDRASFVDPMASVIGDVVLGADVFVAPFASIRGDEGQPVGIGDASNVQDGVVIHALETVAHGRPVSGRTYEVGGVQYAVYVGERVSLAHQSQVHGPARIDDDVFIGMQALVFKAWIGRGSVLEPGARVIGVSVAPGRYVPAGMVVTDQAAADRLPEITENYPFRGLNEAVVHVNTSFARGYRAAALPPDTAPPPPVAHPPAVAAGGH
jgi:carbonic anhydrase/acetyltransferase-like protein (isoleucine patch superfamily)